MEKNLKKDEGFMETWRSYLGIFGEVDVREAEW